MKEQELAAVVAAASATTNWWKNSRETFVRAGDGHKQLFSPVPPVRRAKTHQQTDTHSTEPRKKAKKKIIINSKKRRNYVQPFNLFHHTYAYELPSFAFFHGSPDDIIPVYWKWEATLSIRYIFNLTLESGEKCAIKEKLHSLPEPTDRSEFIFFVRLNDSMARC